MFSDINFCHLIIIDFDAREILFLVQPRSIREAGLGFRGAKVFKYELQIAQWFTSPIDANLTKQVMFNRIPF